jgi:acetoin utilization protein AcuB
MPKHTVQRYMAVSPVVIASHSTLADAHQLMRERGVRHLPVVEGTRLVGVVSQRDLYLIESLRNVDASADTVAEAMNAEPYAVAPDAPLEEVAREMAEHKYGSAVVVHRGEVVGIFTTVDALRALAYVLRRGRPAAAPRGPSRALEPR